ncbi:hypothetical protein [Taklimakanibacter albus]|uniref:Uncharacterized protein n=1 Tax=Taklimakanibacter albus TaxID=2800327 RepID=A0ACC5R4N4_9HYPH|nr:hypothetical protein [Aestuariivirga sp. YIM B02566]MBK1867599.1 hypothetical protein [Aestuariivirga sp. YIM B02566]
MIITVSETGELGLDAPDDFRRFEIQVNRVGITVAQIMAALRTLGEVSDDGHVWVGEPALVKLAGREGNDAWLARLAAMKDKARPFGWVDDDRHAIRAHIKWPAQDDNRTA